MSMYFEIVNYCNMRCAHCGMNALSERAKNRQRMSWDTFCNAQALAPEDEEVWITVGGGEPTLHPLFRRMCERLLVFTNWNVGVITNGSRPRQCAWMLQKMEEYREMHQEDRFHALLSLDQFHNRAIVKDCVVSAFKLRGNIRTVTDIIRVGRARTSKTIPSYMYRDQHPYFVNQQHDCFCRSTHIHANGDVRPCGCDDVPVIGNVNDPEDREWLQSIMSFDCCWHEEDAGDDEPTWAHLRAQGKIPVKQRENLVLTGDNL